MANLFAELKRRHIYRVAAAYAVVAWVLLQLFNNLEPILKLPEWAGTLVLVLLLGGFPVAILLAWIHQLAPADGAAARATTGKLDWVLIGALVVVIVLVSYEQLTPATGTRTAQQATVATGTANVAGISIAVLPFVNLSSDKEQEFFSDGMTEEITSALAKVPNLRVVARTSAFEFKGQNRDVQRIAQALHTTHVIEGSVRKDGNQVRITAQLIKADDGTHLWTESYDRELKGVFAVQEEIAQAIAGALRVPLGLKQGETLVSNRTEDLDSYQQYLRARAQFRGRLIPEAIASLEPLIGRDPGFAPAWALLARAYSLVPFYSAALRRGPLEEARRVVQSALASAEKAAQEAIRLDARNAVGLGMLGYIQARAGKWSSAEDISRQALALDPNEPDVLDTFSQTLAAIGRVKEAVGLRERLRVVEPFVPQFNTATAEILQLGGQYEASIPVLEAVPASAAGPTRTVYLARAYAHEGRYSEAADALLAMPPQEQVSRQSVQDAAKLLRTAPAKAATPLSLPALEGELNFVYVYVGAPDRVLEFSERSAELGRWMNATGTRFLWVPEIAPVRKTERFKALVRKIGLVDYWRERGWPDLCRPMGANDFVCD